jgi:hypothetical protein
MKEIFKKVMIDRYSSPVSCGDRVLPFGRPSGSWDKVRIFQLFRLYTFLFVKAKVSLGEVGTALPATQR